jgi:hypothetical protein
MGKVIEIEIVAVRKIAKESSFGGYGIGFKFSSTSHIIGLTVYCCPRS